MKDVLKDFGFIEKKIHMGTFDYSVVCLLGKDDKLQDYIRWKFENNTWEITKGESLGWCFYNRGFVPVIWIPRYPKTPKEHATLAHEALHAVWHLFAWAGMPITRDTEEVMTHAMSHIIRTVLEK